MLAGVPDNFTPQERRYRMWLKWAVVGWMVAIIGFHLGNAILGKTIYRDIHLGTALEYTKGSINLLKPIIVGYNANNAPTPQELPVWQAVTALVFKMFGTWFGWASLVSLMFLFSALYPLHRIAEKLEGKEYARWTLVFFLAQPLVFLFAGEAATDGLCLASAIWFMFFASRLCETQSAALFLLTVASGSLAIVSKLPFFLAAGMGCFFLTATAYRRNARVWIWLGSAALVIGIVFFAWAKYVNDCYAQAEFTFIDLRSNGPGMRFWYFGDWHYRLSPAVWIKGIWRILGGCFGSFAIAIIFLFGLFSKNSGHLTRCWLAGCIVSILIFFHLVLVHWHYYLMLTPVIALFSAHVAVQFKLLLKPANSRYAYFWFVAIMAGLFLSTIQGLAEMHLITEYDSYPKQMVKWIQQYTKDSDKLVIEGGGWGGQMLFLSDRRGLSIVNTHFLEDKKNVQRLKALGFNKLVMVSESPIHTAMMQDSSATLLPRVTYKNFKTPVVDGWPTIFQNDDILIKELPDLESH
jgi:hypothetical protein